MSPKTTPRAPTASAVLRAARFASASMREPYACSRPGRRIKQPQQPRLLREGKPAGFLGRRLPESNRCKRLCSPLHFETPAFRESPPASRDLALSQEGSGVRHDLAHLDVFERDRVGNDRRHPLAHIRGGFLGVEDDHRQARAVVRPCPVPGYEPWGLRYAGYNVLAQ